MANSRRAALFQAATDLRETADHGGLQVLDDEGEPLHRASEIIPDVFRQTSVLLGNVARAPGSTVDELQALRGEAQTIIDLLDAGDPGIRPERRQALQTAIGLIDNVIDLF